MIQIIRIITHSEIISDSLKRILFHINRDIHWFGIKDAWHVNFKIYDSPVYWLTLYFFGSGLHVSTGNNDVETQNIDSFASENIELTQFYVSPCCIPTRASLVT